MKNKIIPIVCIFLLVFNIFINYSYGFTDEENKKVELVAAKMVENAQNATGASIGSYYVFASIDNTVINDTACKYALFYMGSSYWKVYLNNNTISFYSRKGGVQSLNVYYYDSSLNFVDSKTFSADFMQYVTLVDVPSYFKSDVTICVSSSDSTVVEPFFQSAPSVLYQVMEQEKTEKKTIKEILGVLPLILVVVVSFLGLRKALQMLLSFLRRS